MAGVSSAFDLTPCRGEPAQQICQTVGQVDCPDLAWNGVKHRQLLRLARCAIGQRQIIREYSYLAGDRLAALLSDQAEQFVLTFWVFFKLVMH